MIRSWNFEPLEHDMSERYVHVQSSTLVDEEHHESRRGRNKHFNYVHVPL